MKGRGLYSILIYLLVGFTLSLSASAYYDRIVNVLDVHLKDEHPLYYEEEEIVETPPEVYRPNMKEINAIARTLYGECRGVASDMEKAAVVWVILNRYDAGYADSIIEVIEARYQFTGYNPDHPLREDLVALAIDVMERYQRESAGEEDVGRVIPRTYLFFHGDGRRNYFREKFSKYTYWKWSMDNPYVD